MKNKRHKIISHPGAILKDDFLDPLNLSVYAVAQAIDVPRSRLNDIVLARRGISADTALRLGRFFDMSPDYWLNLQTHYDLVMAQAEQDDDLPFITLRDLQPGDASRL